MSESQCVNAPSQACTLRCGGRLLGLDRPRVMGIINVTDDSFFAGSRTLTRRGIARRARQLVSEGADMLDVGACSSRPGSSPISEVQELKRLSKALAVVRRVVPEVPVSIDTFRASVAEAMIRDYSVEIINDIAAGEMDGAMHRVVAKHGVAYIMMHMQGRPATMQEAPSYGDVVSDLLDFFTRKVGHLRSMGIADIVLDPGFGFGKTVEHNYALLRNLSILRTLGHPLLVGVSRKSMLTQPLGIDASQALAASQCAHTMAVLNGASILRVHDARPAAEVIKLCGLYMAQPAW